MDLMNLKLEEELCERGIFTQRGLRFQVIGNRSLIPDGLQLLISGVELVTKDNKTRLNFAISYTAKDDITNGANLILGGLESNLITKEDLNLNLFSNCLYTRGSKVPDLIIRTSGETRLSDFFLFEGFCSYLHFTNTLWPEFSAWDLLWAIFKYQHVCETLDDVLKKFQLNHELSVKGTSFLKSIR